MEADLQRFYGIDYRDRWRGGLTLRRIKTLLFHLPPEAATVTQERGGPYWTVTDHLVDDLRMSLTGTKKNPAKPHPQRPTGKRKRLDPRRIADGRKRRKARNEAIEAGEIT